MDWTHLLFSEVAQRAHQSLVAFTFVRACSCSTRVRLPWPRCIHDRGRFLQFKRVQGKMQDHYENILVQAHFLHQLHLLQLFDLSQLLLLHLLHFLLSLTLLLGKHSCSLCLLFRRLLLCLLRCLLMQKQHTVVHQHAGVTRIRALRRCCTYNLTSKLLRFFTLARCFFHLRNHVHKGCEAVLQSQPQ